MFFYHFNFKSNKRSKTRQDFIRSRSRYLATAINGKDKISFYGKNRVQSNINLTDDVCTAVSEIMENDYSKIKIITHGLYWNGETNRPSKTIWIKKNDRNYSEAFAGTGESRVILIVNDVINAPKKSLLLIDEPEISLHPRAIANLQAFLLEQVLTKKLQIVITTHSPLMIKNLPDDAIKYMSEDANGIVHVNNNTPYDQAFYDLQDEVDTPITLYVEDKLTRATVERVISNSKNSDFFNKKITVLMLSGGANNIITKHIPISANEQATDTFFLLDGDQNRYPFKLDENTFLEDIATNEKIDLANIPMKDINTEYLNRIIECMCGSKISFTPSGGRNGSNKDELLEQQKQFINYWNNHVFFLNYQTPERGIISGLDAECEETDATGKEYFVELAKKRLKCKPTSEDIFVYERESLGNLDKNCQLLSGVNKVIDEILDK